MFTTIMFLEWRESARERERQKGCPTRGFNPHAQRKKNRKPAFLSDSAISDYRARGLVARGFADGHARAIRAPVVIDARSIHTPLLLVTGDPSSLEADVGFYIGILHTRVASTPVVIPRQNFPLSLLSSRSL